MTAQGGKQGFALVELLVSLAILGVAAAMLLSGVVLVRQLAHRAEAQTKGNEAIVTTQSVLRDRIESIVPSLRADFERPIVDMRGTQAILSFFAPPPPAARPTIIQRYRLLRTAAGQLTLFSSPDLSPRVNPYAPGEAGWAPTVLLSGVTALDIDYFGAAPPDNQRRWRRQWVEQFQPPELIRVRLGFARNDPRQWPDLIIRPAATINAACRIEPNSGRCAGT